MNELASEFDRKVQLRLQLQASDGLRGLMSELIKPELSREFAQRALHFTLYTKYPIEIGVDPLNISPDDVAADQTIRDYTNEIEAHGKMYNRSLHLARELGVYNYPRQTDGINIRLKLLLPQIEAGKLLAPPFEQVSADRAYILSHLPNRLLRAPDERQLALQQIRIKMGAVARQHATSATAPDIYFVSRPVIKKLPIRK